MSSHIDSGAGAGEKILGAGQKMDRLRNTDWESLTQGQTGAAKMCRLRNTRDYRGGFFGELDNGIKPV